MMNVEKISVAVFDEMRQIIGDNRISREAFLSAIARGLHAARDGGIEEEREVCAGIVHEEYVMCNDGGFSTFEGLRDAEKRIRARSDAKPG